MRLQDMVLCVCAHVFGSESSAGLAARIVQAEQLHGCGFCPQHPWYTRQYMQDASHCYHLLFNPIKINTDWFIFEEWSEDVW